MFSLILPPIFVVACVLFLVRIFWKKRHLLTRSVQEKKGSFRVRAPHAEGGVSGSKEYRSGLGDLIQAVSGSFVAFLSDFIVRPFHRMSAEMSYRGKQKKGNGANVTRKEQQRSIVEEGFEYGNELVGHGKKERSMISDTVTLPQKKEEKNEYEQVLIERIAINPRDVEAYERLGDYYLEVGVLDDAKECFKQVLRLSPLSRRARFRMRRVEKLLSGR